MKREDIQFPHDVRNPFLNGKPFELVRMMNNKHSANQAVVEACLSAATNTEQFIEMYVARKECRGEQFYAALIQKERPWVAQGEVWDCFRENGYVETRTEDNAASVAIGNGSFSLLIPVSSIDGFAKVATFSRKEKKFWCVDFMDYFAIANGKTNVYKYDALNYDYGEGDIAIAISENAYIYRYSDCIAFELMD